MKNYLKKQEQGKNWLSNFYHRWIEEYTELGRRTLTLSYAILVFFTIPQTIRDNLYKKISDICLKQEIKIELQTVLIPCSCIIVILFMMWLIDRFLNHLLTIANVQEPSFLQITQPVTILTQQKKRKELEEILSPVKHHALHDYPVIEPSLSNITTFEESKLIFDYLGFKTHLCLKNEFIRRFESRKTLLETEDKSFRRQLHYQNTRLIFYRKIMYCSLVFIFFTFGYHIYKEQKPIVSQTAIAAKQDNAKQDNAKQDNAKQDNAKQDNAKQDNAKQDNAKQDNAKQDNAKQDNAKEEPAKQKSPVQLSIYYVYLLYIVLFLLGCMGYVKQRQNINLLIFRVFIKNMQLRPKKRRIYSVS